ncbi:MAG: Gldg family protein [Vicinamibacterales bacterium]
MKKYSYLPGFLLLVAAAIRSALDGAWDSTGLVMAAVGGVIIVASIIWNRAEVMEWLRDPRGVFAVVTGISVVAVIAVLILVNILVWYRPWRADLTASGRNVVTAETRALLERLDRDVVLRQFGAMADPRLDQRLASFAGASRRVRVEFVDTGRNADLVRDLGVIRNGTVIVEAGDRHRKVEDPTETALMSAVLHVTRDEVRTICFITGHGERGIADEGARGFSRLTATLEAANYKVEQVSLLEGDVPDHCSVLVIAGPREPFADVEMQRLDQYRKSARGVAVMVEPDPSQSMGAWLTQFGIEPEPGIIVDASGTGRQIGAGPEVPLAFTYGDHQITRDFGVATLFDGARSLKVAERAPLGGRPMALASTTERSFVGERTGNQIRVDTKGGRKGPFVLAAVTSLKLAGVNRPEELRMVVYGDADFISNARLWSQGNRDFFLRSIAWLAGEEQATIVSVEGHENRRIQLTERTKIWMYLINVGFLPLLPLTLGIIAFLRSKR